MHNQGAYNKENKSACILSRKSTREVKSNDESFLGTHVWNVIRAQIITTSFVETPLHNKTTALCVSLLVRAARNF